MSITLFFILVPVPLVRCFTDELRPLDSDLVDILREEQRIVFNAELHEVDAEAILVVCALDGGEFSHVVEGHYVGGEAH